MTPNFALNLSEDGIDLLHRDPAGSGWVKVGTVALDSPSLSDDMHALRDIAVDLEGDGFCTKLILPSQQLLYATVDANTDAQIAEALEERTPYKIDDLIYDTSGTAPQTKVVAVARETLSEARAFLAPYNLNPVGFTAQPDATLFDAEPNLGPIGSRPGFMADKTVIKVVEDYAKPLKKAADEADDETIDGVPVTDETEDQVTKEAAETITEPSERLEPLEASPAEDIPVKDTPLEDTPVENTPKEAKTEVSEEKIESTEKVEASEEVAPKPTEIAPPPSENPPEKPSGFSSRRKQTTDTPILSGERLANLEPRIAVPNPHAKPTLKLSAETPKLVAEKPKVQIDATQTPTDKKPATKPVSKKADAKTASRPAAMAQTDTKKTAAKPRKDPTRNARAAHLIGTKKIPPAVHAKPKLPATRPAGVRAPAGKMPDPIAALAARQAAATPQRSGILVTFMALVAFGVLALGSVMLLRSDPLGWMSSSEPLDLAIDDAVPVVVEQEIVAPAELVDDFAAIPLDTTLPSGEPTTSAQVELAVVEEPESQPVVELAVAEPEAPIEIPRMNAQAAEQAYASSGAWQFVPDLDLRITPKPPAELFLQSLDQQLAFEDPPALPADAAFTPDGVAPVEEMPLAPGLRFALDEQGLVIATPDGALSPDGVLVFAGLPPVAPNPRPGPDTAEVTPELVEVSPEPVETETEIATISPDVTARAEATGSVGGISPAALDSAASLAPDFEGTEPLPGPQSVEQADLPLPPPDAALAAFRPAPRPGDLQQSIERATLGGLTRIELASFRPDPRPLAAQERAEQLRSSSLADIDAINSAVEQAQEVPLAAPAPLDAETSALRAIRPAARPSNLSETAAPPRANTAPDQASTASVRATGPAVRRSSRVEPTGPTTATVARAATDNNALSLGRVALVGVFGTSSDRRALVRLPNGRFKKVTVGDSVDGGRVAAIGEDQLKYVKGGRTLTLAMPQG